MNALTLLHKDHEHTLSLFERFESQSPRAFRTKAELLERIAEALRVHTRIEEEIFYPAVREDSRDLEGDVKEDLEEHHLVKVLLDELSGMDPEDARYDAKVHVLKENVTHHVESEEEELFPEVEERWDEKTLEDLGRKLEARKRELTGGTREVRA